MNNFFQPASFRGQNDARGRPGPAAGVPSGQQPLSRPAARGIVRRRALAQTLTAVQQTSAPVLASPAPQPAPTTRAARRQPPPQVLTGPAQTGLQEGLHAPHLRLALYAGHTPLLPPLLSFWPGPQPQTDALATVEAEALGLFLARTLSEAEEAQARASLATALSCPMAGLALADPVFVEHLGLSASRARAAGQAGGPPAAVREDLLMREVVQLCSQLADAALQELWQGLHDALQCPIALALLADPCIDAEGHVFSGSSIRRALGERKLCPLSRAPLQQQELLEHKTLRALTHWVGDVAFLSSQKNPACPDAAESCVHGREG